MSEKNFLKTSDKFNIASLLKKRLKPSGNGKFRYEEGWSDAKVAKEYGNGTTEWNVRAVRLAVFGQILPPVGLTRNYKKAAEDKAVPNANLLARLDKMESAVRRLCKEWGVDYD